MIEARGLTKRFGDKLAVDQLSFTVEPGRITGFLGPNGAGKTTTMRLILGLDHPTGGSVTVNGREFPRSASPMREVGALLDAKAMHGGRSAYNHLLCLAQTNGLPRRRVGEVLDLVGLTEVAGKRSKGFSLGMGQRLGIAAALLGDPAILMFDEPVNGLDPEGILWIRTLMKQLAGRGPDGLRLQSPDVGDGEHRRPSDRDRARQAHRRLQRGRVHRSATRCRRSGCARPSRTRWWPPSGGPAAGWPPTGEAIVIHGLAADKVGDLAYENGIRLHELAVAQASLEEAFMELTAASVEFRAGGGAAAEQAEEQGDRVSTGGVA